MGEVVTGKALAVDGPGKQRPYLRTKNVFDGRIDIADVLTMPMTDDQFGQFGLRSGDVLLNEGQSLELVGRCAMYQGEYPEPCAIQNQLIRFRAKAGVSGLFASYVFRFCQQSGVFARVALQTTSIAHLGGSRFQRLRLAWPKSEPEQRAIAAALSDADGLLGGLDRLVAKKRDLKQATMQQILTGQTRLPGFRGEWEVKRLNELADIRSGGTPSTSVPHFWDGDIPWCTPTDITALEGHKYLDETARRITAQGLKSSSAEMIPPHSVVMTSRATIGECAINPVPVSTNQGFKNFVPFASTDAEFLFYLLQTQK
ncbi:MAG: restriction endonuclease subunit S [Verrucomicrobiota bacterium]